MSFFANWHRDALASDGALIFEAGDQQLPEIKAHLATLGHVTFRDDDAVGIADYLRNRHGYVVHRNATQACIAALRDVRASGHFVAPEHKPPALDATYTPTRPGSKAEPRHVLDIVNDVVAYQTPTRTASCTLASWHKWRSGVRARVI